MQNLSNLEKILKLSFILNMLSGFTSFVVSNSWVRNNFPEFPKQQNSLKNVTVVITYQTLPIIYHFFKFSLLPKL